VSLYSFPGNNALHIERSSSDVRSSAMAMHNAYDALSHVISRTEGGNITATPPERISIPWEDINRGFRDVASPIRGFHSSSTERPKIYRKSPSIRVTRPHRRRFVLRIKLFSHSRSTSGVPRLPPTCHTVIRICPPVIIRDITHR